MRKTSLRIATLAAIGWAVLTPPAQSAQPVTYMVTLVTASQPGSGFLEFQFNPGGGSQAANVSISGFTPAATLSGLPAISGAATGSLPSTITLANSTAFNDEFVGFTFGGAATFLVTFSGPAVATPNPNATSGSSFGFSVYANGGVSPLLTTDPNGFAFTIGLNPDGTASVRNFSASAAISSMTSTSPLTREVFVTNAASNSVSVVEPATNQVKATIGVGLVPAFVAINPDGSRAYVAGSIANSVAVISTASNTVIATVAVGHTPVQLAVSPDGSRVYVANAGSNSVSVIHAITNTVIATVPVGHAPSSISISADGGAVYVANTASNSLSVINAATNAVVATVSVGLLPTNVAAH